MFSFFQTIFHKVTIVIAAAAIAIGFISAPEPPKQPVLDNQSPVVAEQQIKEFESQTQKKQSEVNFSTETEKLKKEIESLRKNIDQQNQYPVAVNQPAQQPPQPQLQRTVPSRPENSDEWTFNWNVWAWEKHPSAPTIAPTITLPQQVLPQQNTTNPSNQNQNNQSNIQTTTNSTQVTTTPIPSVPITLSYKPLSFGVFGSDDFIKTDSLSSEPLIIDILEGMNLDKGDIKFKNPKLLVANDKHSNSFCYGGTPLQCLDLEVPGWQITGEENGSFIYEPLNSTFDKVSLIIKNPLKKFNWSDGSQDFIIKYINYPQISFRADGFEIVNCQSGYICNKSSDLINYMNHIGLKFIWAPRCYFSYSGVQEYNEGKIWCEGDPSNDTNLISLVISNSISNAPSMPVAIPISLRVRISNNSIIENTYEIRANSRTTINLNVPASSEISLIGKNDNPGILWSYEIQNLTLNYKNTEYIKSRIELITR